MTSQTPQKNSQKKLDFKKFKKSNQPTSRESSKKAPQSRSQKIFKGPLFWIILAIFAVTIFGQITSAANRYTPVKTSQVVDAISKSEVESAVIIDKAQKIRLVLLSGHTIKGATKVEASYVARQEPTLVDALTANPPTKGWNVDVPTQSFLSSLFFTFGPILVIGFLFFLMMSNAQGGNRVFSFGKSRAKLQNPDVPQNTFADVAGADEAIAELEEIKDFLDTTQAHNIVIKVIQKELGTRKIDDKIVDLSTKVVVELFKTLWTRKGFWESALKNVR